MSLRKSSFDDELGALIEKSLDTYVDRRGPSDDVWQKISEKLESEIVVKPPKRRIMLTMPVLQAVSMALVIIVGSLVIQFQRNQPSDTPEPIASVSADVRLSDFPEMELPGQNKASLTTSTNPIIVLDQVDIHALKKYQRSHNQMIEQPLYPLIISPTDVMPHPLRLRTRIQSSEVAQAIAVLPKGSTQLRRR